MMGGWQRRILRLGGQGSHFPSQLQLPRPRKAQVVASKSRSQMGAPRRSLQRRRWRGRIQSMREAMIPSLSRQSNGISWPPSLVQNGVSMVDPSCTPTFSCPLNVLAGGAKYQSRPSTVLMEPNALLQVILPNSRMQKGSSRKP
jgi:hypothetical protein